ncbi:KEOPS complex kinase/ATPase Bud32 [Candidatus Nanosalina sp. VS9-1]|uniref:KEOPS complex kinase/ATPase Bud32 n=1 Tax=Candidatus Nanosalina sp. VS9-1 TaxID=3388566 RepID=UPI0039E04174
MEIQGAEASVEITDEKAVKRREEKKYRHPDLDERIRDERTREEVKNTRRAIKYGVNAPSAEKKDKDTIEFERINGETWKKSGDLEAMKSAGENVAKMHHGNIIHGDLTTSNIIVNDKEAYLIDFGLSEVSERVEDKAVDIHLLKQIIEASHPEIAEEAWKKFMKGYNDYKESEEVLERLEEVELRGRYK